MQTQKEFELNKEIQTVLLQNDIFIFESDYGKKGVTDKKADRLKNQVTAIKDIRPDRNHNILTGKGDVADVDLDAPEARELADEFLNPTGIEFGRNKHGGRSHRLYKILDLDKKKHTRLSYTFRDSDFDNTVV